MSDEYAAVLFLTVDGVECARLMQRGHREECEFVADHLPAVSHGGPEVVTDARITVMPYKAFMQLVEPEEETQ